MPKSNQKETLTQDEVLAQLEHSELSDEESALFIEVDEELDPLDQISHLNYDEIKTSKLIDSVKQYLIQIGQVALLNEAEETALAKKINEGRIAQNEWELKHTNLKLSELNECRKTIEIGHLAKDKLVNANLRLVVSIAKRYTKFGLPLSDLIQEGNLGLIKAAEKFDYTKGFKFSTYATWWIRQTVTRSIADTSRTIRIPVHLNESLYKIKKIQGILSQYYERAASYEELAIALNSGSDILIKADQKSVSPDSMEPHDLNRFTNPKKFFTAKDVEMILKSEIIPVSMDQAIGDENDSHLEDFIEDKQTIKPDDYTNAKELSIQINKVLKTLTVKEERILQLRFGLADGKIRTLEEVGKILGVTRERIRQIENKAITKLRKTDRCKNLLEFYSGN